MYTNQFLFPLHVNERIFFTNNHNGRNYGGKGEIAIVDDDGWWLLNVNAIMQYKEELLILYNVVMADLDWPGDHMPPKPSYWNITEKNNFQIFIFESPHVEGAFSCGYQFGRGQN